MDTTRGTDTTGDMDTMGGMDTTGGTDTAGSTDTAEGTDTIGDTQGSPEGPATGDFLRVLKHITPAANFGSILFLVQH